MPDWFEKGGVVMYPLLACSFLALALVAERLFFWLIEVAKKNRRSIDHILGLAEEGKFKDALNAAKKSRDPIARILAAGLELPHNSIAQAMEVAAGHEAARMERFLPTMDTLITLSPLLGILGTVTGIIHSFDVLGAAAIVDPQGVTLGVAEALLTTAFGLVIAIFTLIPYNYFSSKAQEALDQMERTSTRLEILVARHLAPPQSRA